MPSFPIMSSPSSMSSATASRLSFNNRASTISALNIIHSPLPFYITPYQALTCPALTLPSGRNPFPTEGHELLFARHPQTLRAARLLLQLSQSHRLSPPCPRHDLSHARES